MKTYPADISTIHETRESSCLDPRRDGRRPLGFVAAPQRILWGSKWDVDLPSVRVCLVMFGPNLEFVASGPPLR
jgi:hypothetical protein